eukprot:jgi/Undpi1/2868/HiC_scaffold_14.g06245.m1
MVGWRIPRATELLDTIEGNQLQAAFVEENGGEGAVVKRPRPGRRGVLSPRSHSLPAEPRLLPGNIPGCVNPEDPGVVTITTCFFKLPIEAIQASLNFDDATLQALIASLPDAPALAQRRCRQRCGLLDDDNFSCDFDS